MKIDVYIFLRFFVIFQNFLSFIYNVLCVSLESNPRHRDWCGTVSAESAAKTMTFNHAYIAAETRQS